MKLNLNYAFGLLCAILITSGSANGQFGVSYPDFALTNTDHVITVNNSAPLLPPGIYNLSIRFISEYGDAWDSDGYNTTIISSVTVVTNNGSQLIITDNTVAFPNFLETIGRIDLTNSGGSYFWIWNYEQNIKEPLPVTLISISAQNYNSSSNKIIWSTADESNLSYYSIERSESGSCFASIGQVPALNTYGTHNYQFFDNNPLKNTSYYRLKIVDIDGRGKYSKVVLAKCLTCNGTTPAINCSQGIISGPSSICDSSIYTLTGVTTCVGPSWSVSPSNIASVKGSLLNSYRAKVKKITTGTVILTATLPGCPTSFSKTITVGSSPISTSYTSSLTQAYTQYYVSVSPATGASTDYSWYNSDSYVGTGYSKYYYVYPNSTIYYHVDKSSVCGTISSSGYLYYQAPSGGGGDCLGGVQYSVSSVPGSGNIAMNRLPCDPPVLPLQAIGGTTDSKSASVSNQKVIIADNYEIKVLDFQGTLKAYATHVSLSNKYNLNVRRLLPGNYVVQIINGGIIQDSRSIRIQ